MEYHILNGDALIENFAATGLAGEILVTRECLVVGDLRGETLEEFYQHRATYIAATYQEKRESYYARVAGEFEKLLAAPHISIFNLWFGYDLFCRTNMWFVLSLLYQKPGHKEVFMVYPSYLAGKDIWLDFGAATPEDLISCYNNRMLLSEGDLSLGNALWQAYKNENLQQLEQLSKMQSPVFPYLEEVVEAHIARFPANGQAGRPEKVLAEIMQNTTDFKEVYREFFSREGIYGFGDSQVKALYDKVLNKKG